VGRAIVRTDAGALDQMFARAQRRQAVYNCAHEETNMPVSTKRKKKDGTPVRRAQPAVAAGTEAATAAHEGGEAQPRIERRIGKPRNPFVEKQGHKASQRGR
jgi:hypothetical protein